MTTQWVEPGGPLRGRLRVPGDKSISHRVLMLAALADGDSTIRGLSDGEDVRCTLQIVAALGAKARVIGDGALSIRGGNLGPADGPLDVGNSGTGIRLLAGLLAGMDFRSVLDGDESIRRRPMGRVLDPLRAMGASVEGSGDGSRAPVTVGGGGLSGIEYRLPVASAQVKGCVLIDGLVRTTVHPGRPGPFDHDVAGDPSQAAFWAVAASVVPGSEVVVGNVYEGPARTGFVDVLRRMGADVTHDPEAGDLVVRSADLSGTAVAADEVPGLVDEVPILAVAAACADGETTFDGVGELRVKESDRLATVESELGRMGAAVRAEGDRLVVRGRPGGAGLRGAAVDSHHDHRIAMSCAVAALVADGSTSIDGWDAVATSYPGFADHLAALRDGDVGAG